MRTEIQEWDGSTQPRSIAGMIGLKCIRAWIIVSDRVFIAQLEGDRFLKVSPVAVAGDLKAAIAIETGDVKPGADLSRLENMNQVPQLIELRGMKFAGVDADVVMFGDGFGVQVTRKGIRFVRAASSLPGEVKQ